MRQGTLIEAPARAVLEVVTLRLPYPPSANRLYKVAAGKGDVPILYKTGEHKRYLGAVSNAVRVAALRNPMIDRLPFALEHELALTVRSFRPMKRGDIDNPLKALFDALICRPDDAFEGAWVDDAQIVELYVRRLDDKEDPRVELEIARLGP